MQEGESQIVTHYDVFDEQRRDRELLLHFVEAQIRKLGRMSQLVTADAGFIRKHKNERFTRKV